MGSQFGVHCSRQESHDGRSVGHLVTRHPQSHPWWDGMVAGVGAAGHTASTSRKQRGMVAGAQLAFTLLFSLKPAQGWCHSH